MDQPGGSKLRISAAIRVLAAVLLAAGLTALLIVAIWGPLDVHTDVIGYPTFKDFNVQNYFNFYYLGVGFFPLAAFLLFLGITRLGPRIGLPVARQTSSLRAAPLHPARPSALDGEPPLAETPPWRQVAVSVARVAFVGAVLGFAVGISSSHPWKGIVLGVAAYELVAAAVTLVLPRFGLAWPLERRLGTVNAVGAVLTVVALVVVSHATKVTVVSDGSVVHYSWFPAWLGLPVAAALAVLVVAALRRGGSAARSLAIERRAMLLVAVPVAIVLLIQSLAGELGPLEGFHFGEQLVGARLVGHGWFPWRDVVLTHGLFQDVIYTYGTGVFGNSVWGFLSGVGIIMGPLYILSVYFLLVYLLGRNWLVLVFAGLIMIDATLAPENFRLILWPLILLLLALALNRPTRTRTVGLAFLIVLQTALTPEAAPSIVAVALVLVAYEWFERSPGASIVSSFSRTLEVGVAGVAFASLFAGYLAANHALDDFVYTSIQLVHGHALSGGLPPVPSPGTVTQAKFDVLALLPPVALVISIGYAIARLRLRRGFSTEDWVMGAAAIFLLFYYPKFLSRMDTGHLYQPFVMALPLLFYIVYRAVEGAEGAIRSRWPGNLSLRLTAHPVGLVVAGLTIVLQWGLLHDRIENAPGRHKVPVTAAPTIQRVGYTQTFDTGALRNLKQVVDAYLGPKDRLFDFSNTPLVFFYLMDRYPSTRYFHVTLTYAATLQNDLIDRLQKAKPKLIVFDNDGDPFIGLSNWDGIPTMVRTYKVSQWILDHYKPLLWTNGFTFYARRDMPPPSKLDLHLTPNPVTHAVADSVQPCTWGYSPNFLSGAAEPPSGAKSVKTRLYPGPDEVTVTGWAGDPNAKRPAREVILADGDRVVERLKPSISRPDLIAYGLPEGIKESGFQTQVPLLPSGRLRIFVVARDGRMGQIVPLGGHPAQGTVTLDGRRIQLDPKAVYGQINSTVRARSTKVALPPGSRWRDYRWLEVDAGASGFKRGTFILYDRQNRPNANREISFQTLDSSPGRYVIPVGSCAQWHAYPAHSLFLNHNAQDISSVRLIR